MKKQILISLILLSSPLIMYAQWNGTSIDGVIWRNGKVGIGTDVPLGLLHVKGGSSWSEHNYGAGLVIDGNQNNSIAILDFSSSNPFAITNKSGDLVFSAMPPLGNVSSVPVNLMSIKRSGSVTIKGGSSWSSSNYGAGLIIKGPYNNSIGIFDSQETNPIAITNNAGELIFSAMPLLGDITNAPANLMKINSNGNVAVSGKLEASAIKVTTSPTTADFVFERDYNLKSLSDIEKYINDNKHLPEIASAKEMEEYGINISEFQIKLLQKIEEMTLYLIEHSKQNEQQRAKIKALEEEIEKLKAASK